MTGSQSRLFDVRARVYRRHDKNDLGTVTEKDHRTTGAVALVVDAATAAFNKRHRLGSVRFQVQATHQLTPAIRVAAHHLRVLLWRSHHRRRGLLVSLELTYFRPSLVAGFNPKRTSGAVGNGATFFVTVPACLEDLDK